mmetsp:Transcript_11943/g.25226  ORF Transcript_11943/g.25226 Transcript_11943/m.25226 type:complete len:201 (-) Transcript_11943:2093-2695(-)
MSNSAHSIALTSSSPSFFSRVHACKAVLLLSSLLFHVTTAPWANALAIPKTSPLFAASYIFFEDFSSRSASVFPPSSEISRKPLHKYLLLIHSSFALRLEVAVGLVQPFCATTPSSQIAFALSFPIARITLASNSVSASNFSERTLLTCTPSDLCTPLQSMHINRPKFKETQSGFNAPQSAHTAFAFIITGVEVVLFTFC